MRLLAIDPGPVESALVGYDCPTGHPAHWVKTRNDELLRLISSGGLTPAGWTGGAGECAIEMVASYGMAVGAEVFRTVWWAGRFAEAWRRRRGKLPIEVYRRDVKLHLCADSRAKDANIRQALIDRYGPGKETAIGRKATPGPLYGLTGDCWSALAVAVTAAETRLLGDIMTNGP